MVKQDDSRRPIRPGDLPGLLARARFDRINLAIEWDKVLRQMAALGLNERDVQYFQLKRLLREGK
jgi:hypothetical protein